MAWADPNGPRCRSESPGEVHTLEGTLEEREREFLLRGEQRLARQQVATGEVGDRRGKSTCDCRVGIRLCSRHTRAHSGGSVERARSPRRVAAAGADGAPDGNDRAPHGPC